MKVSWLIRDYENCKIMPNIQHLNIKTKETSKSIYQTCLLQNDMQTTTRTILHTSHKISFTKMWYVFQDIEF